MSRENAHAHAGSHAPALPHCRNCHFTLATPRPVYCGHCGQETDLHPPSVREMFSEYVGHYVAFDGPLWRTLWALVCLPGHLTNAYFHGRRRRYVLPLRVYLSASFLYFVGTALLPESVDSPEQPPPAAATLGQAVKQESQSRKADKPIDVTSNIEFCDEQSTRSCTAAQRRLNALVEKAESLTIAQWNSRLRALAPYGMLAMQPVFAALLLAMFAGSGRRYAEHFVFSLHSHSLWFLALLLSSAAALSGLLVFAVFGHGVVALRHVYGLGWRGALWRGLLLSVGYFLLLLLGLLALMAAIAASA